MSGGKKRTYRVKSHEYKASRDLKSNLKKINWRLAGILAACFAVIFGVFRVGIYFQYGADNVFRAAIVYKPIVDKGHL